jgi:hypothetical protein
MGIFSLKESDALQQIVKINASISQIREIIRLTDNTIVNSNAKKVAIILKDCAKYYQEYEDIKSKMNFTQELSFMELTINCWNGEQVKVSQWENYFKTAFHILTEGVKDA